MLRASLLLSILCSAVLLHAQPSELSGPVEGFTFDLPTRSLRAVIGSLGSASLGPPFVRDLDFGSVAPGRDHAVSFQNGRCQVLSGLGSSRFSTFELSGVAAVPEDVSWSGNGSVAVLYSRTGNWIQIVRGLPAAPEAGAQRDLSSLHGSLSSVATDLRGERTLIGMAGEAGGVFEIAGELSFVPLLALSKPVALAFSDDGLTLYAVDGASSNLSELNMADLTSQEWPLGVLESASAVRPARDATQRQVIYVAGNSDGLLVSYDALSHEAIAQVPIGSRPTIIEALGRNSYVLGSRGVEGEPLWAFTNAPQPIVYFVPATPLAAEDSGR